MQLNQDPGDGSTVDSGLCAVTMEEEGTEADTAGDEEVEGGERHAAIDVTLDASATDDLAWNDNDPSFDTDDESSGMYRTPVAESTPLSTSTEETVLLPPAFPGNENLCRGILAVEP